MRGLGMDRVVHLPLSKYLLRREFKFYLAGSATLLYHHPYNFIFYSPAAERLLRKWVSEKEKELVKDRRRRHLLLEMFPTFRGEQSL